MRKSLGLVILVASLPWTMGANGCSFSSTAPAPNVTGQWAVDYQSTMQVDVTIGGAVYHQTLGPTGGAFSVLHDGAQLDFNVDCSRPEVVCPSEVWPTSVAIDQRDATYQHRMWVKIPTQTCMGTLAAPDPSQCGAGTLNPDCKPVCSGPVATSSADAFGLIADDGGSFGLLLGGGVISNGLNCALLGASWAQANIVSTGSADHQPWTAESMTAGSVKTAYAGGCLWAGDPNLSGALQPLVVNASVELTTPFTANRQP
jgi:hypothetical protein